MFGQSQDDSASMGGYRGVIRLVAKRAWRNTVAFLVAWRKALFMFVLLALLVLLVDFGFVSGAAVGDPSWGELRQSFLRCVVVSLLGVPLLLLWNSLVAPYQLLREYVDLYDDLLARQEEVDLLARQAGR